MTEPLKVNVSQEAVDQLKHVVRLEINERMFMAEDAAKTMVQVQTFRLMHKHLQQVNSLEELEDLKLLVTESLGISEIAWAPFSNEYGNTPLEEG